MTAPKSGNSRGPDACRGRRPKFEWTRRRFGRSSVLFATALARAPGISPQKSRTKMKPPPSRTSPRNRKECFCSRQNILPRQLESGQPDPRRTPPLRFRVTQKENILRATPHLTSLPPHPSEHRARRHFGTAAIQSHPPAPLALQLHICHL